MNSQPNKKDIGIEDLLDEADQDQKAQGQEAHGQKAQGQKAQGHTKTLKLQGVDSSTLQKEKDPVTLVEQSAIKLEVSQSK